MPLAGLSNHPNLEGNTYIMNRLICSAAAILLAFTQSYTHAQPTAVDNELARLKGHWRIIELVENGNAIPQNQLRDWLPGGGVMEIVDYTILFKSPLDGTKSTKTFRLDPTSYPKQVAIMQRDAVTGTGIYKFDQGKLVICVTKDEASVPTEFTASTGSGRTLMVLERFEPGRAEIPGMNARLPQLKPVSTAGTTTQVVSAASAKSAPSATDVSPVPTPVIASSAAARVLTDAEVSAMALGTWRMNDGEGSIDIVINQNGVFRTFRYRQALNQFQVVFVPTPISTGDWSVSNGRLIMNVRSSTRADQLNQIYAPSVRSISAKDMILVDHLGRVSTAAKIH